MLWQQQATDKMYKVQVHCVISTITAYHDIKIKHALASS